MNLGGPSCAVATVEHLTGIRMDHFVEFDFNSFRTMVDTLGGVEVCVPQAVSTTPSSNLHLSAGKHLITGNQALALRPHQARRRRDAAATWAADRAAAGVHLLARSRRSSSQGTLGQPGQALRHRQHRHPGGDRGPGLGSVSKLLSWPGPCVHLRPEDVTFITMPTVTDPANPDRLLPEEPQDDVLFQMILSGQLWPRHLPTLPPGQVRVRVLNGTGIAGLAGRTADSLRQLGFQVTGTGNTAPASTSTVAYSGTAQADSAYTLMTAVKGAPAAENMLAEPAPQARPARSRSSSARASPG